MPKRLWVYLAGPINGCDDAEATAWREEVKRALPEGVTFLDPTDRDFRGAEAMFADYLVQSDKADIDRCDVVIAMAERPTWGTAMEIGYADDIGKLVIAVCADERPSPWLSYHAEIVPTLGAAVQVLAQLVAGEDPASLIERNQAL